MIEPVTILFTVAGGRSFLHPCYSADEHLDFVRDMSSMYPDFRFVVYEQARPDDGPWLKPGSVTELTSDRL